MASANWYPTQDAEPVSTTAGATNACAVLLTLAAQVAANMIVSGITDISNNHSRNTKSKILTTGLGVNMRECFLDMDSGDIVYF